MAMTGSAPTGFGAFAGHDDPHARARLRRMKLVAGGLLGVASILYLASFALPDNQAAGYLRAATEAGMVGGLADWFAVTALFRHPLGLKIPHTALVPRKKDDIATKLGEFVEGNFVTPDRVAEFIKRSKPIQRSGEWLADPAHVEAVAHEAGALICAGLATIDRRQAAEIAQRVVRSDLNRRSYAPVMGELLATAVHGRTHDPLVDFIIREARPLLIRHRETLHEPLKDLLSSLSRVVRMLATHGVVDRLIDWAIDSLEDMERRGRDHPIRPALDGLLNRLADELRADGDMARTVDDQLLRLVDQERTLALLERLITDMLDSAQLTMAETGPDGTLPRAVTKLGERMRTDAEFGATLESLLERGARFVVTRYSGQIIPFIQAQVAAWDAEEASQRIETAVGRDLQFIRINGTMVGSLAGVAIHSVAVALGHG
ncbi:MAG TPA: DUF445 domain-containing protein [Sporichthyaceae bacterium]|jgi:uncharacterized membrane-anchored protein YjiN (DUF445 family)